MEHPIRKRYTYHRWANGRFLEHLNELPPAVYEQEVNSVFSSVAEVIRHIYQVDGMWLSVMSGSTFEETMQVIQTLQEESSGGSLQQMEELFNDLFLKYRTFLDQTNPDKVIEITHPRYGTMHVPVADLLEHVVNHGTYHRGNITAMLRQQGHPGVPNDYIFYLNEQHQQQQK